ncbi:helicase-related protein [Methylomonas methanica]|nr:helicase-related protein [Methylomonas methanica]
MTAALFLSGRPDTRILFTAPRRTLLTQLHDRSRWLNPSHPVQLVGLDPRENDRHVAASSRYAPILFGMPEFLANRIARGAVPPDLVERVGLLIIDEFDAFLTLRYLARRTAVSFHEPLERLISALPSTCRLLLVSATTPEIASPKADANVEAQIDASAQTAFRQFLDDTLAPAYVSIAERYYADFIPHAQIVAVAVHDASVQEIDRAIDDEVSLMINWISGEVGFPINPAYVLPRLTHIREGRLGLAPGGVRVKGMEKVSALLGRLQLMHHLPDFLYEDMARGFEAYSADVWRYTTDLDGRYEVTVNRVDAPNKEGDQIVMRPEPRGKFDAVRTIVARRTGERGVIFLRNIRILRVLAESLSGDGRALVCVHGERTDAENDQALRRFRAVDGTLLLITRDTGKRGLDLPEGDFSIFYSPKSREDVTWQEVSRIRSTIRNRKSTYMLFYEDTGEEEKMSAMIKALERTTHSKEIRICAATTL